MLAEVGKGFFMVARLGNWSFSRGNLEFGGSSTRRQWVSYEETVA